MKRNALIAAGLVSAILVIGGVIFFIGPNKSQTPEVPVTSQVVVEAPEEDRVYESIVLSDYVEPEKEVEQAQVVVEEFKWVDTEATDQKYVVRADVNFYAEPHEESEVVGTLPLGSVFTFDNLTEDMEGNALNYGKLIWSEEGITGYISFADIEEYVAPVTPAKQQPTMTDEEKALEQQLIRENMNNGGWTVSEDTYPDDVDTGKPGEASDYANEKGVTFE